MFQDNILLMKTSLETTASISDLVARCPEEQMPGVEAPSPQWMR